MDKITIICAVAADFVSPSGEKFSITKRDLGLVKSVPAWIQKTKMFRWLSADGSLKFVTPHNQIQLENDPLLGLGADGKQITADPEAPAADPEAPAADPEPAKRGGRKPKADAAKPVVAVAEPVSPEELEKVGE